MEMDSLCGHVLHHLTVLTVFSLLANLNFSYPLMLILLPCITVNSWSFLLVVSLLIRMIRLTRDPPQSLPFPQTEEASSLSLCFHIRFSRPLSALVYCHLPHTGEEDKTAGFQMWCAEQQGIKASSTGFHTSYSWSQSPGCCWPSSLPGHTSSSHLLSIRMPRLFPEICPQAVSAQPVSLLGAFLSQMQVSAFVLVEFHKVLPAQFCYLSRYL